MRMVRFGYGEEEEYTDRQRDGIEEMGRNDSRTAGREYPEGDECGAEEAPGDAEGETIRDSPQSRRKAVGRSTKGDVYFVQTEDEKYIKIGWSLNVPKRYYELRTANPRLRLLGVIGGGREMEAAIHERFIHYHYDGEWFINNDEIRQLISELKLRVLPRDPYRKEGEPPLEPTCLRCGYRWLRRTPEWPKQCPHCKQSGWNVPARKTARKGITAGCRAGRGEEAEG